ncbi:beta family protein [Pseudoalteromonas peptidolytica]|uniref:beta family protein n=1 Tax=Pseudoalteromonas peptidolytica TaxID=61150 RepID=UPI00298D8E99|nr:hypothetical protein [Pseudoalteromonas peptidolytica]MDW7549211.1 hypothetical protein [Pseudoalteromonas peptidolytica]
MKFNEYLYVPTVRTRLSELLGVAELRSDTKQKILPFVCLSKAHSVGEVERVFNKWTTSFDLPSVISLASDKQIQVDEYTQLSDDTSGFKNWLTFLDKMRDSHKGVIPSAQITNSCSRRDFLKQVKELESAFGKVVLKVNPRIKREYQAAVYATSAITNIENLMVIIDNGQINSENQSTALNGSIALLNNLRQEDPEVEIVTSASSFPKSFPPYTIDEDETYGEIPMLEWENYQAIGGSEVAIYGDHASIHNQFYKGGGTFVARVDYPTLGQWIFERRKLPHSKAPREPEITKAARAIIQNELWDEVLNCWGKSRIIDSAEGVLEKFASPGKWISVRVNLHIERTIDFLENKVEGIPNSSLGFEDEWDDEDTW